MAVLLPAQLPPDAPRSEQTVFNSFETLSNDWIVLWSIPIKRFEPRRRGMNEIDFVLLHADLGVFVIEVKGGEIKAENGAWFTRPFGSQDWHALNRSPFAQATDEHFALARYLSDRRGIEIPKNAIVHAVAFPSVTVRGDMGPDAPRSLILDSADLESPEFALRRIRAEFGTLQKLTPSVIATIKKELVPTLEMTVLSSSTAAATIKELERETRRQAQMVNDQAVAYRAMLAQERAFVIGGAGTGKTVIAAKVARDFELAGVRTLLLCHRAGVQSFLQTLLETPLSGRKFNAESNELLQVSSWTGVARAVAAGLKRTSVSVTDANLPDIFFEFRDHLSSPYGAIIIDEGQEFTPLQLDSLKWILDDPDTSPMYIFADPFQHSGLFSTSAIDRANRKVSFKWMPPAGSQVFSLSTNCRNSSQIAEVSAQFYPHGAPVPLVDGPSPIFHTTNTSEIAMRSLRLAQRLVQDQGFRPSQILIVAIGVSLSDLEKAALRIGQPTAQVDKAFRFPLTSKDVRIAIGRPDEVQGLEADVVILAFSGDETTASAREVYIAASRARGLLHVVSNQSRERIAAIARHFLESDTTVPSIGRAEDGFTSQ